MKPLKIVAVTILATLLAGGTYSSHAQDAVLIAQQAYLKASNTGANDNFGLVAVSEDTLVVGANLEDSDATGVNGNPGNNGATDSGAAYVFVRNGTNWVKSEQRSLAEKEMPPSGLRRIWPAASLLVGYSPTFGGCVLLVPRHRPNWAQRTSSYLCS